MRVVAALALLGASHLCAQTDHKDKAADYPFHATAGKIAIGADYLVHSIPAGDQTFVAKDYLVVEVAVFPAFADPVTVDGSTFTLRLNGAKYPLSPVAPGMVVASLKYPDWERHPSAEASAGIGNGSVIFGRPPSVGRFPDDPTQSRPLPRPPGIDEQSGVEHSEPESVEEVITRTALVEGPAGRPVSGFLYFPYKGKIKSLKSVELIFQIKNSSVSLKLL